MRISLSVFLSLICLGVLSQGCDRFDGAIDVKPGKPANPDGYWALTWTIAKGPSTNIVPCAKVDARYVLARIRPKDDRESVTTYRTACAQEVSEAWIPIRPGRWRISADLVAEDGRLIVAVPEHPMTVASPRDRRETPILFKVQ